MRWVFAMVVVLVGIAPVGAQCAGGSCPRPFASADRYEWTPVAGEPDQFFLRRNGRLVGGYDFAAGHYLPWTHGAWQAAAVPPVGLPPPPAAPAIQAKPTGVDLDKLPPPGIYHRGEKISPAEAIEEISRNVPDDKNKLRVTAVVSAESVDAQRKTLAEFFAREKIDQWAIPWVGKIGDTILGRRGFDTSHAGRVYVQNGAGKLLATFEDFKGEDDCPRLKRLLDRWSPDSTPNLLDAILARWNLDPALGYLALVMGAAFLFRSK